MTAKLEIQQASNTSSAEQTRVAQQIARVWLLTNAPSPYQSELLSAIGDRPDIDLEVRFMTAGSPAGRSASQRFRSRVMRSVLPSMFREELHLHPRAIWECACSRRDVFVLSGLYTSLTFLLCVLVLRIRCAPFMVWFERPHPGRKHAVDSMWTEAVLQPARKFFHAIHRMVLSSANRVLCIGTAARDAYQQMGIPQCRLDVVPYCCELDRYDEVDLDAINRVRDHHGLHGQTVYLFSGQMIERKGVDTVIKAFEQIAANRSDVALMLLGKGPQISEYESVVPASLRERVHFPGHVAQDMLPAYFLAADVFVFPSRHDGWGVVINEACAARLPVITTRQTGAAFDLVEEGRSGYLLERDDVLGFANAMQHFLDHPEDIESFGVQARKLVNQFSPVMGAARFHASVEACLKS